MIEYEKHHFLTREEELSLAYLDYPTRPRIYRAKGAINQGIIEPLGDKIIYHPQGEDIELLSGQEEIVIDRDSQYSLVDLTIFGLNEALADAEQGGQLREEFNKELEKYRSCNPLEYGVYAYYPAQGDLVHYAPARWHGLALVASGSRLYQDPDYRMDWEEVRRVFNNTVIAIIGASVGNNIARVLAMDLRPKEMIIADPEFYKLTNANRVMLGYKDLAWSIGKADNEITMWYQRNKAVATAQQIQERDPFIKVFACFEGLQDHNVDVIIGGNKIQSKPNFCIDEADNPEVKIKTRIHCRKNRVRTITASDLGSAVQIDIMPYDTNPDAPLAFNVSDNELLTSLQECKDKPKDKKAWYRFSDALLGDHYRQGEVDAILEGRLQRVFANVPQLGSTTMMASALVTEVVARTQLGYKFPERFYLNKRTLEIKCWGDWV